MYIDYLDNYNKITDETPAMDSNIESLTFKVGFWA